jgi:beta-lactam-binding protein with PASTA domain
LVLSSGPKAKEVSVPALLGLSEAKAKSALEKVNLVLGEVGSEYSSDYPKGQVMWQQYKKDAKLNEGQSVNITVSKGPQAKESTVSIDINFADAPTDVFMLSVILVNGDGTSTVVMNNQERYKSSGSETVQITGKGSGAKVQIFFGDTLYKTVNVDFNTGTVS